MTQLPKTLSTFLFYFIKKQRFGFSYIFFAMVIWAINEAFYPYFVKILVNTVEKLKPGLEHPFYALAYPLSALILSWFMMELAMRSQGIVMMYVWPKFRKNIREATFDYTQGHSHSFFANNFAGNIANKISELPRACEQILDIFITTFFAIILTFFISLALIYQVNLIFGHIMAVWVILFIILTFIYLRRINYAAESHAETVAVLNGQVIDSLSSMMAVRLFARSHYELNYLEQYQNLEIKKSRAAIWVIEELNIIRGVLSFIFIVVMFATLVYGWNQGWVTLGDFSLIAITSFNLVGLVWHCSYNITHVFREIGIVKAALSLTSTTYDIQDIPHAKSLEVYRGEIVFDHVTFQYKRNSNMFEDKTVKIESGQKVGLVGFSGSGKTTFVNLIMRFFDIHSGRILIDGQDISQVTQESLRAQIAMVPQEPVLFHRSIMENIRYGRLEATDEEVYEAARRAHCDEFIQHMEEGFSTIVGERGSKLSGGQRQRIAIARAILKNAPIVILDEATSALDSETEQFIYESFNNLIENSTALVIAHRLSTLKNMDRILVFDKGEIIEDGTVNELLNKNGHFARLWRTHSGGLLPESNNESEDRVIL